MGIENKLYDNSYILYRFYVFHILVIYLFHSFLSYMRTVSEIIHLDGVQRSKFCPTPTMLYRSMSTFSSVNISMSSSSLLQKIQRNKLNWIQKVDMLNNSLSLLFNPLSLDD